MTSNVPFEKNKMAPTLAVSVITTWSVVCLFFVCCMVCLHGLREDFLFTKCKEAERRVKFKGNSKRCGKENEKV